ncbi:uncharacterized protein LOC132759330 [Ruditapes philippinarum]|uniref:uncharacterized protein LOC132759330 n=1 Tax=Ruditapes philippinarum TaxID=129788 RepID=UPI00295C23DB|nr:uncharacterized protein LOC132759330 [Ruditapes philippinarum]
MRHETITKHCWQRKIIVDRSNIINITEMKSNKLVIIVLFLVAFCLPEMLGSGGGNSGCKARAFFYGPECRASVSGRPDARISYHIGFFKKTKLCCKAYTCLRNKCSLQSVGCSNNVQLETVSLPWDNAVETPRVQCKGSPNETNYYFFYYTTRT